MYSMKEIADKIGVDKQRIYRFIKKHNIIEAETRDNTKFYDDDVFNQIKENLGKAESEAPREQEQKPTNTDDKILTILETTIQVLQSQLAEKDRQINDLTETVKTQAQSINALNHRELAEQIQEQTFLVSDTQQEQDNKKWYQFWKGGKN